VVNVSSVSINKTTDTLKVGDTNNLSVVILPNYATNQSVTWTSSDNTIATVDGNKKVSCTVTVGSQSNYIKVNTTISQETTITDDLILAPNARLTVNSGIKVIVNGSIYVYGELYNYGVLNVSDTLYTNNYNNMFYGDST
jgi:uncharacterized protein YjdB